MEKVISAWVVVKKDGNPFMAVRAKTLAIFLSRQDADPVAIKFKTKAVPCKITY